MAKRVICRDDEVDEVLDQHSEYWVLVAVIAYTSHMPRTDDIETRELYFERRTGSDLK
jgi:hypothetical protein